MNTGAQFDFEPRMDPIADARKVSRLGNIKTKLKYQMFPIHNLFQNVFVITEYSKQKNKFELKMVVK